MEASDRDHEAEDAAKICQPDKETDGVRAVTIGPYHRYPQDQVIFDDEYKWAVTRYIARRWAHFDSSIYLQAMAEMELDARRYYAYDFHEEIGSYDFLVMLLLDSAFILFVLDAVGNKELLYSGNDPFGYGTLLLKVQDSIMEIKIDLLRLDNQIPFFAVEQLYVISHCGKPDYHNDYLQEKFRNLVLSGFKDLYPKREKGRRINFEDTEFDHLLHLFHWSRVPEDKYLSAPQ
uniref:Uncharacterized protein n=1 Tax=Ananas comosus var. bracteatus TaxID=296719 RepID=A0A6V7PA21_ANACO|nr:unnamed protein product [Ananas comosus var. bracteatus]